MKDFSKINRKAFIKTSHDSISGAYLMRIKECYSEEKVYDDNTNETIKLKLVPVKRLTKSFKEIKPEKGKDFFKVDGKYYSTNVKEEEIFYPSADEEKSYPIDLKISQYGKEHFQANVFGSLFYLLLDAPKFTVKDKEVDVYDFDAKGFVRKKMPTYTELIGKEVGVMLKFSKRFGKVRVDGYTGEKIFSSPDNPFSYEAYPYAVWVNNYDSQKQISFEMSHFFSKDDHRTFTEKETNEKTQELYKFMLKVSDYDQEIPSEQDQENYRKSQLKKRLNQIKEQFDANMFQSTVMASNKPDVETTNDFDVEPDDMGFDI